MRLPCLVLLSACWSGTAAPPVQPPVESTSTHGPTRLRIVVREDGVGPIGPQFKLSPARIRSVLPGYTLKLERHDTTTILYNLYRQAEQILYIVPFPDCRPFGIHVVSDKVDAPHGWRVGDPLHALEPIDDCECWGGQAHVCYKKGEHVAIVFEDDCSTATADVVGQKITRIVWQPAPWGDASWTMGGEQVDCGEGDEKP